MTKEINNWDKQFGAWSDKKRYLDCAEKPKEVRRREVWLCSVGINVGHEVDGKTKTFLATGFDCTNVSKSNSMGAAYDNARPCNGKNGSIPLSTVRPSGETRIRIPHTNASGKHTEITAGGW
jgi:hypothetical protein